VGMRFHHDSSGDPHIWSHNVSEQEVAEALVDRLESIRGRGTSIISIGRTRAGRYLKVIYSPDDFGADIFVITAFDVPPKQIRAVKRRLKRRRP
jgi:hypothetical protein